MPGEDMRAVNPKMPDNFPQLDSMDFWEGMYDLSEAMGTDAELKQAFEENPARVMAERGVDMLVQMEDGKMGKLTDLMGKLSATDLSKVSSALGNVAFIPEQIINPGLGIGLVVAIALFVGAGLAFLFVEKWVETFEYIFSFVSHGYDILFESLKYQAGGGHGFGPRYGGHDPGDDPTGGIWDAIVDFFGGGDDEGGGGGSDPDDGGGDDGGGFWDTVSGWFGGDDDDDDDLGGDDDTGRAIDPADGNGSFGGSTPSDSNGTGHDPNNIHMPPAGGSGGYPVIGGGDPSITNPGKDPGGTPSIPNGGGGGSTGGGSYPTLGGGDPSITNPGKDPGGTPSIPNGGGGSYPSIGGGNPSITNPGHGGSMPGIPGQGGSIPGIPGQGGSIPGIPGQEGGIGTGGQIPVLPGMPVVTPGGKVPNLPGAPSAPTPGGNVPNLPGAPSAPTPGGNLPNLPGAPGIPTPGGSNPGIPNMPGVPTPGGIPDLGGGWHDITDPRLDVGMPEMTERPRPLDPVAPLAPDARPEIEQKPDFKGPELSENNGGKTLAPDQNSDFKRQPDQDGAAAQPDGGSGLPEGVVPGYDPDNPIPSGDGGTGAQPDGGAQPIPVMPPIGPGYDPDNPVPDGNGGAGGKAPDQGGESDNSGSSGDNGGAAPIKKRPKPIRRPGRILPILIGAGVAGAILAGILIGGRAPGFKKPPETDVPVIGGQEDPGQADGISPGVPGYDPDAPKPSTGSDGAAGGQTDAQLPGGEGSTPAAPSVEAGTEPCAHAEMTAETVKATCTEEGYTVEYCSVCKEELSKTVIEAKGHNWKVREENPGDCENEGYIRYACNGCASEKKEKTGKFGDHVLYVFAESEGNCVSEGLIEYACEVCGKIVKTESTGGGGHQWIEDTQEPWCDSPGGVYLYCPVCETGQFRETTPALGHNIEADICTRCGYDATSGNLPFEPNSPVN